MTQSGFVEHILSIYHDATRPVFAFSFLVCYVASLCPFHHTPYIPYSNASTHVRLSPSCICSLSS